MNLLSFLFGARSKKTPESKFHVGQVWEFTPPVGQPNARLTILRVQNGGMLGTIVHIAISGVSYENGNIEIQHLPFSESAIERSVTVLERESGPVPEFSERYQQWCQDFHAGKEAVFTKTVADAIELVVTGIANDHK